MGDRKMILNKEEIMQAFINANLIENYNFLEEDLIKLANTFIDKALEKLADKQ